MGTDLPDGKGLLQARVVHARCERCRKVAGGLALCGPGGHIQLCHLCLSVLMVEALKLKFPEAFHDA